MTLAPTLYDFQISLSQTDRGVDQPGLSFKVARHPSETISRVWLRVLAYCWLWEDRLAFGPGLGDPDAPDLEVKDFTGIVTRWVRVGKADPVKIQRAVDHHPSGRVAVVFESVARMESFIQEARAAGTQRVSRAELVAVDGDLLAELAQIDNRRHKLTLTVAGDHFYVTCGDESMDGPISRGIF